MCGYASYKDARLAPPEERDDEPYEAYLRCANGLDCHDTWARWCPDKIMMDPWDWLHCSTLCARFGEAQ